MKNKILGILGTPTGYALLTLLLWPASLAIVALGAIVLCSYFLVVGPFVVAGVYRSKRDNPDPTPESLGTLEGNLPAEELPS